MATVILKQKEDLCSLNAEFQRLQALQGLNVKLKVKNKLIHYCIDNALFKVNSIITFKVFIKVLSLSFR